ncbi:MAG: peptidoglycan editing factor PgeF [Prevotella sp.]
MKSEEFVQRLHYYNEGNAVFFSTTRHGGVSQGEYASFNINEYCGDSPEDIAANRKALCDELGITTDRLVMPHQTHGTEVRQIAKDFIALPENVRRMVIEGVDALMTNESGICIGVSTADCIPIIIYDARHHAVSTVHAGWRGTVAGIVEKAVRAMALAYQSEPADLECIIGPGISVDAFEVGMEVYEQFRQAGFGTCSRFVRDKWHVDLKECNRLQLVNLGVKAEAITVSPICTFSDNHDFFSARKQGINSGRIFTGAILS